MKSLIRMGNGATDFDSAFETACSGITSPVGIIVLAAPPLLEKVSYALFAKFPSAKTIGCSGAFAFKGKMCENDFSLVFLLDDVDIICGLIRNISSRPADALMDIAKNANEIRPGDNNTICIEFTTGNEEIMLSIFRSAFNLNNLYKSDAIKLMGGTVYYDIMRPDLNFISYNGKIYKDACAYIMIKNKTGKAYIFHEQLYRKKDDKIFIATKSNAQAREIIEIDNRPAGDVYKENMNCDKIDPNQVSKYPLGRIIDDEIYPISQAYITDHNTIINQTLVNEEDKIAFLEYDPNYRDIITKHRIKLEQDVRNPSLIFVIECAYRFLFLKNMNYLETYINEIDHKNNVIGYVCGGEQCETKHMNQTMVCAIFD